MSNKSGVSSQVLSLPSGGGALKGIGETFSPELFTGTGNFTVPLALPPGRNGLRPELSLGYSTGQGNRSFGLGWGLSVPNVSRKTSKGVPRYDDGASIPKDRDTFILSGYEDLVQISEPEPGVAARFRPRTEGLFARIEHVKDTNDDFWRVGSKDGLVSLYGTPASAGGDPAVVADPEDPSKVFCWELSQTTDTFGNRIEYRYLRDRRSQPDGDDPHVWDQLYLERVRYADYEEDGETRFLVSVTFVYEERPDPFSSYRSGFEIRTTKRCKKIEVRTHPDADLLVRTYELVYLDERAEAGEVPETALPQNAVSLLSQVKVIGHDDNATQELPPLNFGYTRFEPEGRRSQPLLADDDAIPKSSLASDELELVGLFGNGLPDIVEMNGAVRFWRNLGGSTFGVPSTMDEIPAGVRLGDPKVQFGDMNGDGRADLLVQEQGGYYPLSFGGRFRGDFVEYEEQPSMALESPEVRLMDLDGDGVVDALETAADFVLFFNDPVDGWSDVVPVPRKPIEQFPDLSFSDNSFRVKLADMTGDGLQDFVLVNQGRIEYWPYLGYGRWGRRVTMKRSPVFEDEDPTLPLGFDPRRVLLGDVDGDGLDDVVYIEPGGVEPGRATIWINQGGNGWARPFTIEQPSILTDADAVRLVDMLGTGTAGILWTHDEILPGEPTYHFTDLTGGTKPYVLDEINNHMGAITRVKYAPSTRSYLVDLEDSESAWDTPLPFPVQVVERVEVIDELSKGKLTTEFRYHHGYWDGAEREFRGFGMVEQLDTETFEDFNNRGPQFSPPTLTRTWFHLGPVGEESGERTEADFSDEYWGGDAPIIERPAKTVELLRNLPHQQRADAFRSLRGSVLRTELYALDGTDHEGLPYTVTESQYAVREVSKPSDGDDDRRRIFFPHPFAQRVTQWDRGDDPMTKFTFTEDYDDVGQPQLQTQIACPRGWRALEDTPGQPCLATRSQTVYARPSNPETYIMNRVAKVTTHEIQNNGSQRLLDLKDISEDSTALKVIGQTLNFYDGSRFVGLALGKVGEHGALVRSEKLVLTEDILHEAYKSGDTVLNPPEVPPCLLPDADPVATQEYPQAFLELLPPLAGYIFHPGDTNRERGYFVPMAQNQYDLHDGSTGNARGLLTVTKDPLGMSTITGYDRFGLLPTEVTDPVGLVNRASYDERMLQPRWITDPNGNRTLFTYTPLGLLKSTAVMGKEGEQVGDTDDVAGARFEYDFLAFENSFPGARQPVSVRTTQRVHHVNDTEVPLPNRDDTIETVEYSDGFGRLLQTRTQAEDILFGDPVFGGEVLPADQSVTPDDAVGRPRLSEDDLNVVVSGWQIYDNKGRVVEKFEPFFSKGFTYRSPEDEQDLFQRDVLGQRATMFYDSRGQVTRTVNPNGSEQRVVFGVPGSIASPELATPDIFEPTPWEVYTYDANDNAERTHDRTTSTDPTHFDTPTSIEIDALGHTVKSVERNGPDQITDWFVTRSTYDIRGNLLSVTDALGREDAFQYTYDLANNTLRITALDAGLRRLVLDAVGRGVEHRDSKGALALHAYDALQRPIRLWARDREGEQLTLREYLVYGDAPDGGLPVEEAKGANLRGALYQHYDEAGRLTFERYDFKGNVVEKVRQIVSDNEILSVFPSPDDPAPNWEVQAFRVNWQTEATTLEARAAKLLEPFEYRSSTTHDALNRIRSMLYPQDVENQRKELVPEYNRAGALEHVTLDGDTFVEHIAYNAKGQRTLAALGNGVMYRYAYEPKTFHLARLRSETYTKPDPHVPTYKGTGAPLEDFGYVYDLTGNITTIHDRTPKSGISGTPLGADVLDRVFAYDPVYRLLSATGRECDQPPDRPPWNDQPQCADLTRVRAYRQHYHYDPLGNLEQLQHVAGSSSFTRRFELMPRTNRLSSMTIGNGTAKIYNYDYDDNGNLVQENTERHFEWDHGDRMRVYRTQTGESEPSVHAHYLYDSGGRRAKKLVRKGGQIEATVYVDGLFEHHWITKPAAKVENNTLHVMDDQSLIALVRVGDPFPNDATPTVKYYLGDYLDSSSLVTDDNGSQINREEYFPYGETSFGSFARKRYRFTAKERDEESGMYYHGARYYASWLGRWTSCDPAGLIDGTNLYTYTRNNPIAGRDPTGLAAERYKMPGRSRESNEPFGMWLGNTAHRIIAWHYRLQHPSDREAIFTNIYSLDAILRRSNLGDPNALDPGDRELEPDITNTAIRRMFEIKPDNERGLTAGREEIQMYLDAINVAVPKRNPIKPGTGFAGELRITFAGGTQIWRLTWKTAEPGVVLYKWQVSRKHQGDAATAADWTVVSEEDITRFGQVVAQKVDMKLTLSDLIENYEDLVTGPIHFVGWVTTLALSLGTYSRPAPQQGVPMRPPPQLPPKPPVQPPLPPPPKMPPRLPSLPGPTVAPPM